MKQPDNPIDALIEQAANLSLQQLWALSAAIATLIEVKAQNTTNEASQTAQPAGQPKGSIEWKILPETKHGKVYGPYLYWRYWQEGHLKSKYLQGFRADPPPKVL